MSGKLNWDKANARKKLARGDWTGGPTAQELERAGQAWIARYGTGTEALGEPAVDRPKRYPKKRCRRCEAPLVGGKTGNIQWFQRDGKWKPGPLCKKCSAPLRQSPP